MNILYTIGQRFNNCVILSKEPSKCRNTQLKIKCDCGNEKVVYGYLLRNGHTKSCGCLQRKIRSELGKKRPYEFLYNIIKTNAKTTNRICTLSYDDFIKFTTITKCHYCNDDIIWNPHRIRNRNYSNAYYLDRKDNNEGYTVENCVVCCKMCNITKGSQFTYNEMCEIGRVIKLIKEKRIEKSLHGRNK